MRNFHIILILIAALWSVLPAGSPFHSLFARSGEDLDSGGVIATSDPDTDPAVIFMPPPR